MICLNLTAEYLMFLFHICLISFKVRTSHKVCEKAKVPSLGFAETAEKVFENGPPGARKYASFAR